MVRQFVKVLSRADRIDNMDNREATFYGKFFFLSENQDKETADVMPQTHLTFSRMTVVDAAPGVKRSLSLRNDRGLDFFRVSSIKRVDISEHVAGTVAKLRNCIHKRTR